MIENVKFCIKIADVTVGLEGRYEESVDFCKGYLSEDNNADFVVTVTEEQIEKEYVSCEGRNSRQFCENILFLKGIINSLPTYGRLVFHGVAVKAFGKAYVFTAPSGTGKSTHASLLKKYFGDEVAIINGDKPIIGMKDGVATVFSSPWCGKERWQTVDEAPLGGIVLLKRGTKNSIEKMDPSEYLKELFFQIFKPETNEDLIKMIEIMDRISQGTPFYLLECDVSKEAAETSFKMMKENL